MYCNHYVIFKHHGEMSNANVSTHLSRLSQQIVKRIALTLQSSFDLNAAVEAVQAVEAAEREEALRLGISPSRTGAIANELLARGKLQ